MPYLFQLVRATEKAIARAIPTRTNYGRILSVIHFLMDQKQEHSTTQLFIISMISVFARRILHQDLLYEVHSRFMEWIDDAIVSNGCLYDCGLYDSLDYQVEGLLLAALVHNLLMPFTAINYKQYRTPRGQSLDMSLTYLIPYLRGERLHIKYLYPSVGVSKRPQQWHSFLSVQDIQFDACRSAIRICGQQ